MSLSINKFLNSHKDLIADIGNVNYNKYSYKKMKELVTLCDPFCDNIILHCPCNSETIAEKTSTSPETITYIASIREMLNMLGFEDFNIKTVHIGKVKNYSVISLKEHERKQRSTPVTEKSGHGYISFKISLKDVPMKEVVDKLKPHIKSLNQRFLFLESIDVTIDCTGNITREEIKNWLINIRNLPPSELFMTHMTEILQNIGVPSENVFKESFYF